MLSSGAFGYLLDYLLWWVLLASIFVHTWCFFRYFPRKKHPRSGLLLGNLLVFLCLLAAVGMIGESYFRFLYVATDSFGMSLPARRWFAIYTNLNSHGCRDREWTVEKAAGVYRIAFVGDSFTYGWGIERPEDRFPDRLAAKFDAQDPGRVEVMNVAKPGWGTQDELAPIADMVTRYRVDEIVLCYVPNDIEKRIPRTAEFDPIRPPEPQWFDPDQSCLLDYLYRRIWVPRVSTVRGYHDWLAKGFTDPAIWKRHVRDLADIARFCSENHTRLRVVLLPFIRTGGTAFDPHVVHAKLARFLEGQDVEVLDLLPVLDDRDASRLTVNAYDSHPNEQAHALFAEAIWKAFYDGGL